jgi:hypothetical protein
MKLLLFPAVFILSLSTAAQKNTSINHSINDDGHQLSIIIKGTVNEKSIDYNRVFDVEGMTKMQKNALKERVYDSLGLSSPPEPHAPVAPRAPAALTPLPPAEPGAPAISLKSEYTEIYSSGGHHPYTKEIQYNPQTGLLHMKYRFVKTGAEITMEKSVEAKDKSKEERDQIIKKFEKEIGIAAPEII